MENRNPGDSPEKQKRRPRGEGTVFPRGDKWRAQVTVRGKRKSVDADTEAEAWQELRTLLNRRDEGTLATGRAPTVGEWVAHWLSIHQHRLAPSTHASYAGIFDANIRPALGRIRVDELTMEDVERFYAELRARELKPKYIYQHHALLRVSMKEAVWRGHAARNVVANVQPPSIPKPKTESFSEADADAILTAAHGDRLEARWILGIEYGLRPAEVLGLEWTDLDFNTGRLSIRKQLQWIKLPGEKGRLILRELTKTDSGLRTIKLPPYLVDMLGEVRRQQLLDMAEAGDAWQSFEWEGQPRAFMFTVRTGGPLRERWDTQQWYRLCDAAGVPRTRRYTGRHTAASTMIRDGIDVAVVAHTLGHSDPSFTMRVYVHALDESIDALADRAERRGQRRQNAANRRS
jgi:integrase